MVSTTLAPYRPRRSLLETLALPFKAAGAALVSGTKAAALVFARGGTVWGNTAWGLSWRTGRTFDYAAAIGDGSTSSVLMAVLRAIGDQLPEPPARVYRLGADGEPEVVPGHRLERLLRRPNPYMTGELLWKFISNCQHTTGNAYLYKVRSGAGIPVELWPLHPLHVQPKWPEEAENTTWISHYEYTPNGIPIPLGRSDVVHLPLDIDPDNMRLGRNPLKSLFAELFTDQEAAAFTAALLRNMGVPGAIFTVEPTAAGAPPSQETLDRYKLEYMQKFSGDRRGEPMFIGGPMKVQGLPSLTAEQLQLAQSRMMSESRVAAVLGVPAIVVGFLVGLEHGTYNNLAGLREHFVESKMVPYWRQLAASLSLSLLPDFSDDDDGVEVQFDLSKVRALSEDQDKVWERAGNALAKGGIMLSDFRRAVGLPEQDNTDVYYLPQTVAVVPADQIGMPEPAPVEPQQALPVPRARVTEVPAQERERPAVRGIRSAARHEYVPPNTHTESAPNSPTATRDADDAITVAEDVLRSEHATTTTKE